MERTHTFWSTPEEVMQEIGREDFNALLAWLSARYNFECAYVIDFFFPSSGHRTEITLSYTYTKNLVPSMREIEDEVRRFLFNLENAGADAYVTIGNDLIWVRLLFRG